MHDFPTFHTAACTLNDHEGLGPEGRMVKCNDDEHECALMQQMLGSIMPQQGHVAHEYMMHTLRKMKSATRLNCQKHSLHLYATQLYVHIMTTTRDE